MQAHANVPLPQMFFIFCVFLTGDVGFGLGAGREGGVLHRACVTCPQSHEADGIQDAWKNAAAGGLMEKADAMEIKIKIPQKNL